jgi:hypothetical protein
VQCFSIYYANDRYKCRLCAFNKNIASRGVGHGPPVMPELVIHLFSGYYFIGEERAFKRDAKYQLSMTDKQINDWLARKTLVEVF